VRVTVAAIEATLELWALLRRDDALEMLSDPDGVLVVDEAVLRCRAAVNRICRQKSATVSDRGVRLLRVAVPARRHRPAIASSQDMGQSPARLIAAHVPGWHQLHAQATHTGADHQARGQGLRARGQRRRGSGRGWTPRLGGAYPRTRVQKVPGCPERAEPHPLVRPGNSLPRRPFGPTGDVHIGPMHNEFT